MTRRMLNYGVPPGTRSSGGMVYAGKSRVKTQDDGTRHVKLSRRDLALLRLALAESARREDPGSRQALVATPYEAPSPYAAVVDVPVSEDYLTACTGALRAFIGARPVDDTVRARQVYDLLLQANDRQAA